MTSGTFLPPPGPTGTLLVGIFGKLGKFGMFGTFGMFGLVGRCPGLGAPQYDGGEEGVGGRYDDPCGEPYDGEGGEPYDEDGEEAGRPMFS